MLKFNNESGKYILELAGIFFIYEEYPDGDFVEDATYTAKYYHKNLFNIAGFMHNDIQEFYGKVDLQTIIENLGQPTIDIDNGQVTYCEQKFDNEHIFCFEFLDDEFNDLQYFSIDG